MMDATAAAAVQCHYQSGRYHEALLVMEHHSSDRTPTLHLGTDTTTPLSERDAEKWITAEDGPPVLAPKLKLRAELAALPLSARRADMAMCRFRSAAHSSASLTREASSPMKESNEKAPTLLGLWKEAIQTNDTFRQALTGASRALINTCFIEMEYLLQIKLQSTVAEQRSEEHTSIQNAMRSTARSMLMAAVASAHLYLHQVDTANEDRKSWDVLVQSAVMAADLLGACKELTKSILGENSTKDQIKYTLESALSILNDALVDEQSAVALHSFRSAVKVSALVCGKLILPRIDLHENNDQQPMRKRLKMRNDPPPHVTLVDNDVWNAVYCHGDAALHSRERLVDAISFHSALIHCKTKTNPSNHITDSSRQRSINDLVINRENSFHAALHWETKLKALAIGEFPFGTTVDAGYVWKIFTCLCSLEIADDAGHSTTINYSNDRKKNIAALNQLATSSTSIFACDMMGCIHACNKEYSRAIEMFQMALERGGKISDILSHRANHVDIDSDIEMNQKFIQHRLLSNMACCFVAMGDKDAALELLLHIWTALNEPNSDIDCEPWPNALLLSNHSKRAETKGMTNALMHATRMKLLWVTFYASSLAGDWTTCLDVTDLLKENSGSDEGSLYHTSIVICNLFALLQCRRGNKSHSIARDLVLKLDALDVHSVQKNCLSNLANLYLADAIQMSKSAHHDSLSQYTNNAMASLNMHFSELHLESRGALLEIRALTLNNHGISCLIDGDSVGALHHFRKASELLSLSQSKTNEQYFWLLLPIHFNLALLCLRDGQIDESAKTWLSVRGHLSTWESAMRSDADALSKLRDSHLLAMNRYGMVLAMRNTTITSSTSLEYENVLWVPPVVMEEKWHEETRCINGINTAQVCTLDFLLLKYVLSIAEKKSNALQRRKAAPLHY